MYDDEIEEGLNEVRFQTKALTPSIIEVHIEPPSQEMLAEYVAKTFVRDYSVSKEFKALVSEKVDALVSARVNDAISTEIEAILLTPRVRTDDLGNPIEAPKTLLERLNESVKFWGAELVDSDGKPGKPDSYNRDRFKTRTDWAMQRMIGRELTDAINKEIKAIADQLRAAAQANIAKQMAAKLAEIIK